MSDYLEDTKISIINFNYFRQYWGFLTFPWPKKTNDFIKKSAIVQLWIWSICSWNMLMRGGGRGGGVKWTTFDINNSIRWQLIFLYEFCKKFSEQLFCKTCWDNFHRIELYIVNLAIIWKNVWKYLNKKHLFYTTELNSWTK